MCRLFFDLSYQCLVLVTVIVIVIVIILSQVIVIVIVSNLGVDLF